MTQQVVIPKGLVNPNETTVVEIPKNLQNVQCVVARRVNPGRPKAWNPESWPSVPSKLEQSYKRDTTVPPAAEKMPKAALNYSGKGASYYGTPFDPDATPPYHGGYWFPKSPHDRYMTRLSPGPVGYSGLAVGTEEDSQGEVYDLMMGGFHPEVESTPRGRNDPAETSLYRDFKPPRTGTPAVTPPGRNMWTMKHYHSSLGTVSPSDWEDYYRKAEVTTESSDGIQTEITEEKSYLQDESAVGEEEEEGEGEEECPCDSSGGYENYEMSGLSPDSSSPRRMNQRDLLDSLGNLESSEMGQIMEDLNQFQSARRKLVFDASSLASAADVSNSLLQNSALL